MPWIKTDTNEDKYVISKYVKEDLPTWDEVYNAFYKEKLYKYNSQDDKVLDHYWKIPRKLYIITMMCNQFNKTLHEDGKHDEFLKYVKEILSTSVKFDEKMISNVSRATWAFLPVSINETAIGDECEFTPNTKNYIRVFVTHNSFPPIYTYPDPDGKENPFIINQDIPRIHVDNDKELDINLDNVFVLSAILESGDYEIIVFPTDHDIFDHLIEFMLKPYCEYFEGEGIGWKDGQGHIIDHDKRFINDNDPAL